MRPWILALLLVAACSAACSGAAGRPDSLGKRDPQLSPEERAALVLPPTAETRAVLARLGQANDLGRSWARLHYLVDLYDHARVFRDAAARDLLLATLEAPGGGDAVLDALLVACDRLLALDRLHPGALAARTLLERDRHPPTSRESLFPRVVAVKAIARGAGPLAANALLRLHDLCELALLDAAAAPPSSRTERIDTCLYPLYDADPAPYFAPDPARRPPHPAWRDLAEATLGLAEELGRQGSRLSPAGARLIADDRADHERIAPALPTPPDPAPLRLPRVTAAEPYLDTPLLRLGDGSRPSAEHAAALTPLVRADGRGRVAVALAADARGEALVDAAGTTLAAGAFTLELAVATPQRLNPVPGDYWQARVGSDPVVVRLSVLPLALDELTPAAATARAADSDRPRASGWDPVRAPLRIHLVVSTGEWQLASAEGAFPAIPVAEDAAAASAALEGQLQTLRRAFPDEAGLLVFLRPGVSLRGVAQALVSARGQYPTLALAPSGPVAKGDLWARVQRRAKADVGLPADLASRVPAVRACWLAAVDRDVPAGSLLLESDGKTTRVLEGPADEALRGCVSERLAPALAARSSRRARVELTR